MPLSLPKTRKSSGMFLYITIIAAGILGGYFYYSKILAPSKTPIDLPNISNTDTLGKFKDLKSFDFDIFSTPSLKSLKIFGDMPVQPGVTGRDDIFAPY